MSTLRNNLLIAATVGLMAIGGCATTGGNLSSSATRLERSAYALQEEARDDGERSGFRSDARELAEEARDFRRTVEDHRVFEGRRARGFQRCLEALSCDERRSGAFAQSGSGAGISAGNGSVPGRGA